MEVKTRAAHADEPYPHGLLAPCQHLNDPLLV